MKPIQHASLKNAAQRYGWDMDSPLGLLQTNGRMKASLVTVYEIKTNHKPKRTQLFLIGTAGEKNKPKNTSPDVFTERAIRKGHE